MPLCMEGSSSLVKRASSDIKSSVSRFLRYELDLEKGTAVELTDLSGAEEDFATVNPHYWGRPYNVFWAVRWLRHDGRTIIVKHDISAGTATPWQVPESLSASEPVFVPAPGAGRGEDDGVLLVPVLDGADESSALLVLNATTMRPVARLRAPVVMNQGLHNLWVDPALLSQGNYTSTISELQSGMQGDYICSEAIL